MFSIVCSREGFCYQEWPERGNKGADLHIARGVNFADRVGMTNDQKSLSDIKMKPTTVIMLNQHGYETLEEMAHLSSAEILRMPGMGGSD